MTDNKILLRLLVTALVCGMTVVGCATPKDVKEVFVEVQKEHAEDNTHFKEVNNKLDTLLKPPSLPTYPEKARIVPVSMEIIERTKAENIDLARLDYYLSANITVYINETNDKLELQNGKLVEKKINLSEEIPVTIADAGEMVYSGKDFFCVSFTEDNLVLRFQKNTQRNRFDLVSANKRDKNYTLNFENERPYLVINYPYIPNEEHIQVQGVGVSALIKNKNEFDNNGSPPGGQDSSLPVENSAEKSVEIINSTVKIEERGTLTPAAIVQFILEQNCNYSQSFLEEFIGAYYSEAVKLGINHDLAIAQMCYVTKFLRNSNVMYTHNYAGFITMPASGRFRSKEEGIQAHIQHLKGYANGEYKPSPIVDPRWNNINSIRGTIDNLDGLAKIWSPDNSNYAAEISGIINNMRRNTQGGRGV